MGVRGPSTSSASATSWGKTSGATARSECGATPQGSWAQLLEQASEFIQRLVDGSDPVREPLHD